MIYEIDLGEIVKPVFDIIPGDISLFAGLLSYMGPINCLSDSLIYLVDYAKCRIIHTFEYSFFLDAILGSEGKPVDGKKIKHAINEEEWERIKYVFKARNLFLDCFPIESRKELVLHMDICIKSKDRHFQTLHLRSVPLALTRKGFPWLEIHALTLSPSHNSDIIMLTHKNQQPCYIYDKDTPWRYSTST